MQKWEEYGLYVFVIISILYSIIWIPTAKANTHDRKFLIECIKNTSNKKCFKIRRIYFGDREGEIIEAYALPDRRHSEGWFKYGDQRKIYIEDIQIGNILYRRRNQQERWSEIKCVKFKNPFNFLLGFKKVEQVSMDNLNGKECIIFRLCEPSERKGIVSWHIDNAEIVVDKKQRIILKIKIGGFMDGSRKEIMECFDFEEKNYINEPARR
jgi:hypothetical protein